MHLTCDLFGLTLNQMPPCKLKNWLLVVLESEKIIMYIVHYVDAFSSKTGMIEVQSVSNTLVL